MTVSLTLFWCVALYSSMSCRLNVAVSERVHMVIVVPSSTGDVPRRTPRAAA